MSIIRPDLPALPSARPAAGAAQDVRAAFFRAALDQAQGVVPAAVQVPMRTTEVPRRESATSEALNRSMRPGSLLDIRI